MEDETSVADSKVDLQLYQLTMEDRDTISNFSASNLVVTGEIEFDGINLLRWLIMATDNSDPGIWASLTRLFPVLSEILATSNVAKPRVDEAHLKVELVTRCFIKIVLSKFTSEGDEIIMRVLHQVMEELQKTPEFVTEHPLLSSFFVFRVAKVLARLGHIPYAMEACTFAKQMTSRNYMSALEGNLRLGLSLLRLGLIPGLDIQEILCNLIRDPSTTETDFEWKSLLLTGTVRESNWLFDPKLDLEMVEDSLFKSLILEGETDNDAARQAAILLTLAQYHLKKESAISHHGCLILSEQATAGFQQAECRCSPYSMKTYILDELFGTLQCPRHRLLAEALHLQGTVQRQEGYIDKAMKSFQEGLDLSLQCNSKHQQLKFHEELVVTKAVMSPGSSLNGVPEMFPFRSQNFNLNIRSHLIEIAKLRKSLGHQVSEVKSMTAGFGLIADPPKGVGEEVRLKSEELIAQLQEWSQQGHQGWEVPSVMEQLALADPFEDLPAELRLTAEKAMAQFEEMLLQEKLSCDYLGLVQAHFGLFCLNRFLNNQRAYEEHMHLAAEAVKLVSSDLRSSMTWRMRETQMHSLMIMGQVAMSPESMELDDACALWHEAFLLAEKMFDEATVISEDHALHCFENTKLATMALAKCHLLKGLHYKISVLDVQQMAPVEHVEDNDQRFAGRCTVNANEYNEFQTAVYKSLVWAERGKGRFLMSKVGMVGFDNLNSTCEEIDFENRFMTDDDFALSILKGWPQKTLQSKKTVFVEYTFIDQYTLMTTVLTDGSGLVDRGGLVLGMTDLSQDIDRKTQLEAEAELAMIQKASNKLDKEKASSSNSQLEAEAELAMIQKARDKGKQEASRSNTSEWDVGNDQLNLSMPNILKAILSDIEDGSQLNRTKLLTEARISEELGLGTNATNKVLSAMNKHGVNRAPSNPWIPGMVAGIQRRAAIALENHKKNKSFDREEKEIRRLLTTLYAVLIEPVKQLLDSLICTPGVEYTLVFVPHEDLGVVPFAALHEQGGSRYLIEDYAITVSPAIWCSRYLESSYENRVRSGRAEGSPVFVGRTADYPPGWNPLFQAHEEVAAGAQALGPTTLTMVDDTPDMTNFMKERVMEVLPSASWIHLAVHGEISSQFPQGSLLLGDRDDQRLTATEIITSAKSSPWHARCVVASACQSGLGMVAGGGIMGFARSFILAGVPSCVLSMWEVDEEFCTKFMSVFYSELQSESATLAGAIQSTIKSIIKVPKDITSRNRRSRRSRVASTSPSSAPEPEPEPKWSLIFWAAFACFGYPAVQLPDSVTGPKLDIHVPRLTTEPGSTYNVWISTNKSELFDKAEG